MLRTVLPAILVCTVLGLWALTFLLGSTPDEEEFRFAILSTWLHVDALRQGQPNYWTDLLGLGLPQPFTPNFILHPLLPLLAVVSPVTWTRMLLLAHTLLGTAGIWRLTRHMGVTRVTGAVCVWTFLLATPAQNYVLTDLWLSHYIVWTTAPWLLLFAWRLLKADRQALPIWTLVCGLCAGLVFADANPGHVVVFVVVAAAVVTAYPRQAADRVRWIVMAILIAAAIGSPNLAHLAHEREFFAPDLPSWNLTDPLPLWTAWNAFYSPIAFTDERVPFTRMLFFGGPFAVLCLIGCVQYARRHVDLVLVVAICTVLLFTPLLPLPFLSARFHFRDPLILAAIPLAGLALDRLFGSRKSRSVAMLIVVAQLLVLVTSAHPAFARAWIGDSRRAEWFRGATGATDSIEALLQLTQPRGRMIFSPLVDEEIHDARRLWEGLGVNALAYRGLPVVNGWFKGVSTDPVWPDERLFYGRARAPQMFLESASGLDVLGIRYVLTDPAEPVAADLLERGIVAKKDGTPLVLYENRDVWAEAFVLDSEAERLSLRGLPGCENNRLLCTDFAPLSKHRLADRLSVTIRNGRISVRLSPVNEACLLVVSQMFRPDWAVRADAVRLTTVPVFGGLIGVRVPPGVSSIELRYRPVGLILAAALAGGTLVAGLGTLIALFWSARRTPRPERRDPISTPAGTA